MKAAVLKSKPNSTSFSPLLVATRLPSSRLSAARPGLGLKEAKELVDGSQAHQREGLQDEADKLAEELEAGEVEVK